MRVSDAYGRGSGFLPRGFDTKSSAMKTAQAGGQSEREHADARAEAAYQEGIAEGRRQAFEELADAPEKRNAGRPAHRLG